MASVIKGKAKCPECGSNQDVKHDGRKFYINCSECRTMTNYQSKVAQARVLERMTVEPKEPKPAPLPAHKHLTDDPNKQVIEKAVTSHENRQSQNPFFADFNLL